MVYSNFYLIELNGVFVCVYTTVLEFTYMHSLYAPHLFLYNLL